MIASKLKAGCALCAAAMLLCCAGCGSKKDTGSSAAESSAAESSAAEDGVHVIAADEVDADLAACVKAYFDALDRKDYDAFLKTLYPPYKEAYHKMLEAEGVKPEDDFLRMSRSFDEDGYESWSLTELTLSYYENEESTVENYFSRYIEGEYFDEKFAEDCKADCTEMHDVIFSLSALYEGDKEPVTVVDNVGILAVKNKDGWYVFG